MKIKIKGRYIIFTSSLLIISICIEGCYTLDEMNKDELKAYKGEKQIYLLTSDLDKYVIAKDGYHISSDTVFITGKKIELNGEASNFKGI